MPVALPPEDKKVESPTLKIQEIPISSQVVESRSQSYDTTLSYLPGSKQAIDYYGQYIAPDSAPSAANADRAIPYGQLILYRDMEMIVSTPPTPKQQDGRGRGFEASGDSILYGVITPQAGDIFLTDFGDGRNVMFQVNTTEKLSVFQESPYRITWSAVAFVDEENLLALNARVIDTLFFMRENYRNGLRAFLTRSEVDSVGRLRNAFRRLLNGYFESFFADRYMTFVMPHQGQPVYDPYVTRFMRAILGTRMHPKAFKIVELGVSGDAYYDTPNIFDVVLQKDLPSLYSCVKKMAIAPIGRYRTHPMMISIYTSGMAGVVAPLETQYSVNINPKTRQWPTTPIAKAGPHSTKLADILPRLNLDTGDVEPRPQETSYIHRVLVDDYYVLSKAFYEDLPGQSRLEHLLRTLLDADPIDIDQLAELAEYAVKFDNLERFYYVPLILAMIKLTPGVL